MTYEETLHYLYNQLPVFQQVGSSAYKPGLGNSEALDVFFDHPHRKYHTIHITGTNGKGSTSHLLAAILQQSGYKVGLYTSPHLVDFRERIRVNGEVISKEAVMDFTQRYIEPTRNIHPSFFELTMMMAFDYFAACKVDVAVIEVGLGGRLDSTNIITPDLSIITNISFDHVQFLGNTLPEIAKEKAGIIKPNIPVLIGEAEGEIKQVFIDKARCENSPIYFAEDIKPIIHSRLEDSGKWIFESNKYPNLTGELGGFCQEKNAATVLAAIELLQQMNYEIPDKAVYQGFRNVTKLTGLQGRWQRINDIPKVICDTGHNIGGIQYIVRQLNSEKYRTLRIVIGMVNDKDINGVLSILPQDAIYYFTQASIPRALPSQEMMQKGLAHGLIGTHFPTVKEAYKKAINDSDPSDLIFVGGSTFIVADLLSFLKQKCLTTKM